MTKKTIDPSKTYKTRHGWNVRNVGPRVYQESDYTFEAEVYDPISGAWRYETYTPLGEAWVGSAHDWDLIEVDAQESPAQPTTGNVRKDATYRTFDGRQARILCTDAVGPYPVAALVRNPAFLTFPETDDVFMYTADGKEVAYCGDLDDEYYSSLALVEVKSEAAQYQSYAVADQDLQEAENAAWSTHR